MQMNNTPKSPAVSGYHRCNHGCLSVINYSVFINSEFIDDKNTH